MERTLQRETLFKGLIFDVERIDIEVEGGGTSQRDVVRHRGAVGVVARYRNGNFLLVRQYRKAVEQNLLEIVAGTLDPGEAPAVCAARELREETGHRALVLERLGCVLPSPGYTDERIELFHAWVDDTPDAQQLDEDERVLVECIARDELFRSMADGDLCDGKSLAAFGLFLLKEGTLACAP